MRKLAEYRRKRDFRKTSEPKPGKGKSKGKKPIFVVQEHHASHLHYDFRLEVNGVLRSWAVPKGPSLDPKTKRLAVEVEDHPLSYASFEGHIPEGEYGGGDVYLWDKGEWAPKGDAEESLKNGKLEFELEGEKLKGAWMLIRSGRGGKKPQWLLFKRKDEFAKIDEEEGAKEAQAPAKKRKAKQPAMPPGFLPVELATLAKEPPSGKGWFHEEKFDGYRAEAVLKNGRVTLFTRAGQDWTSHYPPIEKALRRLGTVDAVLDGEIVWERKGGHDFQKLQNAVGKRDFKPLRYYVFDLLRLSGHDLRGLPLRDRKALLKELLEGLDGPVLYTEHEEGDPSPLFQRYCRKKIEGLVSKRAGSNYLSGRKEDWIKSKCQERQEFVIAGYTEGEGSRVGFGALLLGVYEGGKLRYAGKVGTGFTRRSLLELKKKMVPLEVKASPFSSSPRMKNVHWLRPKLVAEIKFANWTEDRIARVPVFQGLREDKPADEIKEEKPVEEFTGEAEAVTISHPEKIYYRKEEITKGQVAEFYRAVAHWMLPHLRNRPLSVLRCPDGTSGQCFFQRHRGKGLPPSVAGVEIEEENGPREYMTVGSPQGLLSLAQWGCLEFHTWNCRRESLDKPDQVVMDFDPGPGVSWRKTANAAQELREILDSLGMRCFAKVTGGKGVHVHIPFLAEQGWAEVKAFAAALAREMASRSPELYVIESSKMARKGKIFLDYLRNDAHATSIAPYSLRAKEESSVAMPVHWEELKKLPGGDAFSLEEAIEHLRQRIEDPWKDYLQPQRIALFGAGRKKRAA